MRVPIFAAVLALAVSGCGSGGGSAVQPATGQPVQTNSQNDNASIESTITVPAMQSTQSTKRSAQYVSASTLGLKITVTDIPPTGKTASFTPLITVYALGIGLNKIVVPTPASASGHSEDLTYVAYDQAPVAGVIPGAAKAVGYGITTGFVVVPGQNTNNVVLSGVVDTFAAPLAETGAFGMLNAQTTSGFGGAAVPSGIATLFDAGGNDITTAAGAPWPVVGSVPTLATTVGTGVPVTIVETAGTCGAVGAGPHLKLSYNGGAAATTAAITSTSGSIGAVYDGGGGAGWSAIVSAKGQTQTLTYALSTLAATSTTNSDFSCPTQTLSFSYSNETALMTIVEHTAATPYTITEPNTTACTQMVNVYSGNSTAPANLIVAGTPTSLGAATTFTIQLIPVPAAPTTPCNIEVQDANAAATGGPVFPGATTYVSALLPPATYSIIVP